MVIALIDGGLGGVNITGQVVMDGFECYPLPARRMERLINPRQAPCTERRLDEVAAECLLLRHAPIDTPSAGVASIRKGGLGQVRLHRALKDAVTSRA